MNKLKVGSIEITMIKNGVIWKNVKTKESITMTEEDIIPVVNATAEMYEAVLRSKVNQIDKKIKG